jgi:hypothetical protein
MGMVATVSKKANQQKEARSESAVELREIEVAKWGDSTQGKPEKEVTPEIISKIEDTQQI